MYPLLTTKKVFNASTISIHCYSRHRGLIPTPSSQDQNTPHCPVCPHPCLVTRFFLGFLSSMLMTPSCFLRLFLMPRSSPSFTFCFIDAEGRHNTFIRSSDLTPSSSSSLGQLIPPFNIHVYRTAHLFSYCTH